MLCSTRTTSGTSRARTSASGRGTRTPASHCSPRCRADPVGLRICGAPPPAVRAVARRRTSAPVSRRCAARCPSRPGSRTGSASGSRTSCASTASRESRSESTWQIWSRSSASARGRARHGRVPGPPRGTKIKTARRSRCSTSRPVSSTRSTRRSCRMLRPGVYEHEIVARAHQLLFEMGSEQVEAVNAVSGTAATRTRTCSPTGSCGRGTGVLRHHPLVHGLPDVLHRVQRRRRQPGAARRVQAVPRMARRGDRARPAGHDDGPDRGGLADSRGAASRTRRPASASSSGTGSAWGSTSRR